ncbi:MAG: hypothetical protein ABR608_09965 [Pseudonocardiaceae bacterium]
MPGTALAQETTPLDDVVDTLEQMANSAGVAPAAPAPSAPVPGAVPAAPEVPALPLDSDDDTGSHETPNPEFPDHGSGYVGDLHLNDEDILDLTQYDATVEDDGSTHSDVRVLGLFGDEIVGSGSSSDGTTESHENPAEGLCQGSGGALCLSLLYHDTIATVDDEGSIAGARGGVLSLCLLGEDENVTTTYECKGLLGAGAAEGEGTAVRDGKTGHTWADSVNDLLKACIAEGWGDDFTCDGLLGVSVLHANTNAESETPENTSRASWLIGLDSGGEALLRVEDPAGLELVDCANVALLCLYLNQGETFIFDNPAGGSAAQEALHLDLLQGTPLDILVILGQSESIAHLESPEGCEPGEKGPCPVKKPECSDKVDNDGDGKVDFPADPECVDANDDSEADGKKGGAGLAETGADVAPLLAGAFLLIGMGALTVAATRRRVGKHNI